MVRGGDILIQSGNLSIGPEKKKGNATDMSSGGAPFEYIRIY